MNLLQSIRSLLGGAFSISRGYGTSHDGVDIKADEGTPIRAVASGTVSYAKNAANDPQAGSFWAKGGGNVVEIDVGNQLTTQYAHMQRFVVQKGQYVSKGQIIGYVGHTGNATGPHIHFGLWDRSKNKMIDPTSWLVQQADKSPQSPDDRDTQLGAWGDIIKFPVGHIITKADVDLMMKKLGDAGFFTEGPTRVVSETVTRGILETAIGKQWDKSLQIDLQQRFDVAAKEAGAAGGLAGIPEAISGFGDTLIKVATYGGALLLILFGLFIYNKGGEGYGPA